MECIFRRQFLFFALLVGGIGVLSPAFAQGGAPDPGDVRHELRASVIAPPDPSSRDPVQTDTPADLTLSVKVVEFTPDSSFYSVLSPHFTRLDRRRGAPGRIIWADSKCHRDRGLPKVSLLAVEGSVGDGPANSKVSARPRRIGLLIPPDEIIEQKQIATEQRNIQPDVVISILARTSLSRLRIQLDLLARRCRP